MYINRKAQILGQDCLLRMCPRNALLGAIDLGHLHGSAQDHPLLGAIDLGHLHGSAQDHPLLGAIDLGHLHGSAQDHALLGAHFLGTFLIRIAFISERFVNVFRC